MLRETILVVADILKENNIATRDLYLVLEKCLGTVTIIKEVTDKDTGQIEVIAESIESFMLILELAHWYSTGGKEDLEKKG